MQHDVVDGTCSEKQIFAPALQNYFIVTNFKRCSHLSYGIFDCLLINEGNNFIITSTSGETIHHIDGLRSDARSGSHSMNLSREELFFIEKDYNIVKLSKYKEKTKTTFIKCMQETDSAWRPWCIYCSQITDDVLVGMKKLDRIQGKVIRYNNLGEEIQEIQHNEIGSDIYSTPRYITENINGDVVVSDSTGAVVVTDREGRHRFSYKGHPPESKLSPLGICTDTLSHILVCDELTHAIQIIDKDGHFLSNLLIKPSGIVSPSCLCYDVNADLLWVGSDVNYSVCLYKYLSPKDLLTDENSEYEDTYEECCLVQADL
nr:uncharacterized protein LOC117687931 isoform X2 [Crassostrea gigas]